MHGIPKDLLLSLRQALLACDEFYAPRQLYAVMQAKDLKPFQTGLPSADNPKARVDITINYLSNKHLTSGENALVLLLRIISDCYDPEDGRRKQLLDLADQLTWLDERPSKLETTALEENSKPSVPLEQPIIAEKSKSPPTRRKRVRVPFKLQIARRVGRELEVRALETPSGEPRATGRLPYNYVELTAVLKALRSPSLNENQFKLEHREALRSLNLLVDSGLIPDLQKQVGLALYQALFPGDVDTAFKMAWNQTRRQRGTVVLQLRFDEDAVMLARCPWELVYYRRHLLAGGAVDLVRYISYPEAPTTLSIDPPLRVLYVEPRPTNLKSLHRQAEQENVYDALAPLEDNGLVLLDKLSPPTYDALIDRIELGQDHVFHFDGHGTFARQCPVCGSMNYSCHVPCQQAGCEHSLDGVRSLGYLAFEHGDGSDQVDWVNSNSLGHLLYSSSMRLAVLSACRSGEVRGKTLFGGLGPALIQSGMPSVVAMQMPITVQAAARFMQGLYGALTRFEPLPAAMACGRRRLFRGREWFIPLLYLRSRDDEGQLFKSM